MACFTQRPIFVVFFLQTETCASQTATKNWNLLGLKCLLSWNSLCADDVCTFKYFLHQILRLKKQPFDFSKILWCFQNIAVWADWHINFCHKRWRELGWDYLFVRLMAKWNINNHYFCSLWRHQKLADNKFKPEVRSQKNYWYCTFKGNCIVCLFVFHRHSSFFDYFHGKNHCITS